MKTLKYLGLILTFVFASLSTNAQSEKSQVELNKEESEKSQVELNKEESKKIAKVSEFEIKGDPFLILFEIPQIAVEKIINENIGLEGQLRYIGQGVNSLSFTMLGKNYFNPRNGADNFYVGLYGRLSLNTDRDKEVGGGLAVGPAVGYKWATKSVVFDTHIGIGKFLGEGKEYDGLFTLSMGYRFQK